MPAGRAADAIRLDREFVCSDPHAAAVRAAGQLDFLISERLVLAAVKTIDGFPVQQPRLPRIVEDRQDKIVMVHIVFNVGAVRKAVLDGFSAHRLIGARAP